MLELTLKDQILSFVHKFYLVERTQILRFFRNWDKRQVAFELQQLISYKKVFVHPGDKISCARRLPSPVYTYQDTIEALYVMCEIPSNRVSWFYRDEYPANLVFTTNDNKLYDITTFDDRNWVGKYTLIKKTWHLNLPDEEKDPAIHIALVSSKDLIEDLEKLGVFKMYATLDANNKPTLYKYDR